MIKNKLKNMIFKTFLVMVGLFLFSVVHSNPAEAAKPIKMRFAWPLTEGHPMTATAKSLIKDLEEASNGTVAIKFYGAQALGKGTEYDELVKEGMADIALFSAAYNPSQYPMTRFVEMPFFSNSSKASSHVLKALLDKKLISKEFDQHKLLFTIPSPPTQLFSNKKITKVEDFKGLRLMGMGLAWNQTMGLLGAQCVTMNMQDMYIALQRGTLDAGPTGFASVMGYKWIEVVDYPIDIGLMGGYASMIIMNKKTWSKLTPQVQAAWTKVSEKHALIWADLFDKFEVVGRSKWPAAGKEIQAFPAAEKEKLGQILMPVYQDWIDQMEKEGKPGKAIYKTYVEAMKKNGQPVTVKLPGLYE